MASVLSSAIKTGAATEFTARSFVKYKLAVGVGLIMLSIYGFYRWYQQTYALSMGLDSTTPEFELYWMTLLKVELVVIPLIAAVLWPYLWITRDRHIDRLSVDDELTRYFTYILWIFLYAISFFAVVPLFGENDAAWHQTVVRDTSFTPSHIVVFYACIPMFIVLGVGTYLYATTRLPKYADKTSVPLVLAVVGPFMILPNLGYNEFGHAFWLVEEIFSHPLHWGFVVMGWSVLALGGLLMQVMHHLIDIIRRMRKEGAAA